MTKLYFLFIFALIHYSTANLLTSCGETPQVENGYISNQTMTKLIGSVRPIVCNDENRYFIDGNPFIYCSREGWTKPGRCLAKPQCHSKDLPFMQGAYFVKLSQTKQWHFAMFKCIDGYILEGAAFVTCEPDRNVWKVRGECRSIDNYYPSIRHCILDPQVPYADVVDGGNQVGTLRTFVCKPGFSLTGIDQVRCDEQTGKWMASGNCHRPHLCLDKTPTIKNGILQPGGIYVGAKRNINCHHSFLLVGPRHIECTEFGWSEPGFCLGM